MDYKYFLNNESFLEGYYDAIYDEEFNAKEFWKKHKKKILAASVAAGTVGGAAIHAKQQSDRYAGMQSVKEKALKKGRYNLYDDSMTGYSKKKKAVALYSPTHDKHPHDSFVVNDITDKQLRKMGREYKRKNKGQKIDKSSFKIED